MPVVTDLKPQKQAAHRWNVYLDGSFAFSVGDLEISARGLQIGTELSHHDIVELSQSAHRAKAYTKAVDYIAVRPRSTAETKQYLRRNGVEDVEGIVDKLQTSGLLDDRLFASAWIDNRKTLRPRSKAILQAELRQKGIAQEDIDGALAGYGDDEEVDAAVRLSEKRMRLSSYAAPAKLTAYLARKGFAYNTIKKALERLGVENASDI